LGTVLDVGLKHTRPDPNPPPGSWQEAAAMHSGTSCKGSDNGLAGGVRGGADPPVLTGGFGPSPKSARLPMVRGKRAGFAVTDERARVGVDALTVTMGSETDEWLEVRTDLGRVGTPQKGFRGTEERAWIGGTYWRKWGPSQPSKRWGMDYVTCEWKGPGSAYAARELKGRPDTRPSRVDVAFDFDVEDHVRAETVIEVCRPHMRERRITEGHTGEGQVWTYYAGAASSDLRVRIYRRDLKDKALAFQQGPILRIELVMKDAYASRWWQAWAADQDQAYAAAAHYIERLTGLKVQEHRAELPPAEADPDAETAQRVFEFIQQHASMVRMADELRIDLAKLAKLQAAKWSKQTRHEHKKRMHATGGVTGEDVERWCIEMIEGAPAID
jgi:hypothetical protein